MNRTQDEIVDRLRAVVADERMFDFRSDPLIEALDAEHVREFLTPDAELSDHVAEDPVTASDGYLAFAFGKAMDHRGLSAARSVQKLSEWAWLRGRDDVAEQMNDDANHPQYGVPALVLFAEAFDLPVPSDPRLLRMSAGAMCSDHCDEGCGT